MAPSRIAWPLLLQGLLAAPLAAQSQSSMKGEWGQEVLGCRCNGRKGTHGYCGYHFHWGSQEDKPWCRTMHGCGNSGLKGAWIHCDARAVERRRGDDGKHYNSKEMKEFYGDKGKDKWTGAEKYIERRMAKNGQAYTVFQFRDYYIDALGEQGWVSEWEAAKPEQRQANDGVWYAWEEFVKHYGDVKAWEMWNSAKLSIKSEL